MINAKINSIMNRTNFAHSKQKGFTLIELLVVVVIIGILASLATFAYQDAQAKSRDSRRKADLDAIKKALELAKQDSTGGYYYKSALSTLATTYMKSVPTDPKTGGNYIYAPAPSPGCTTTDTCTSYTLTTCIENKKDPQKDSTPDANCTGTTGASYTVSN